MRMILADSVSAEDVVTVMETLGLEPMEHRDTQQAFELIWCTQDRSRFVRYMEDYLLSVRYLLLEGSQVERLESELASHLSFAERADVIADLKAAASRDQRITALYRSAAFAGQSFDRELFGEFEKALAHEDPSVRSAAVFATTYPGWREFRPILERLSNADPSAEVQQMATTTLDALSTHRWRNS